VQTFRDMKGRLWEAHLTIGMVKRIKAMTGVDLYEAKDNKFTFAEKVLGDPITAVDVLFVILKDQADKIGVTDEEFGRSLGGDSLGAALTALWEAIIDFFPDPTVRQALRDLKEASDKMRVAALEKVHEYLEKLDPEALLSQLMNSSVSSPESPASTPTS
jgi:hypothetical protein